MFQGPQGPDFFFVELFILVLCVIGCLLLFVFCVLLICFRLLFVVYVCSLFVLFFCPFVAFCLNGR